MKLDLDVAELESLRHRRWPASAGEIVAIAQPHHVERFLRRQHLAMAGPGMVGMAMRDHRALDRPHRIDMKAAGLAAQAGGDRHQDVLRAHLRLYSSATDVRICQGSTTVDQIQSCPHACSCHPAIMIADRRFDFARDLQMQGDLAAAADLLMQATELAPGFASAWFSLGEIRQQLGERDAAIMAFRKALRRRPRRPPRRRAAADAARRRAIAGRCRRPMSAPCSTSMRRSSKRRWWTISAIAGRRFCSKPCWRSAPRHASRRSSTARSISAAAPVFAARAFANQVDRVHRHRSVAAA